MNGVADIALLSRDQIKFFSFKQKEYAGVTHGGRCEEPTDEQYLK